MCTLYNVLKSFFLICKCMLFLLYLYHFGLCCINNNVFAWVGGWMCVRVCSVSVCLCGCIHMCVRFGCVWKPMININGHSHSPPPCFTEPETNYSAGLSAALPLPRLQMGPAVPSDSPDSGRYAGEEALHPPCCFLAQIIRYLKENRYIPHVLQPLERTVQINSDSDS